MKTLSKEQLASMESKGAKVDRKRSKVTPIPTPVVNIPKIDTTIQERAIRTQIEATVALTEIAAKAIENPQLEQLITLLSKPTEVQPRAKRLIVNRDSNGLIESIDIQNI